MEKMDFTKRYAKRIRSTPAEAADQIDRVVNDLLTRLRSGQPASLPGLGDLAPFAPRQAPGRRARSKPKLKTAKTQDTAR